MQQLRHWYHLFSIYVQDLNGKLKLIVLLQCILLAHSLSCTPSPFLFRSFTSGIWENPDTTISVGGGGGLKGNIPQYFFSLSICDLMIICSSVLANSGCAFIHNIFYCSDCCLLLHLFFTRRRMISRQRWRNN